MNEEKNLDEYEFPVHTPSIKDEQIQRPFKQSKIIKETQITCNYHDLIISIRMMALGEVQVFLYEKQEILQRYIIKIDGGMICQNGCQIFNINNQIHLLFILQDGQIILRNLSKEQSQSMIDLKMDLIMISKSNQVKDNIHFAALKEGNELLDISINTNELQAKPLKLQTSWLDYFKQNKGFDFFLEIWQGLHILVCNDQLQIVQINYNSVDQFRHRVNLTDVQRKIQEIEYIPFSPFINYKRRQIYASIIVKTYSTLDLYELTLNCDHLAQSIQAQQIVKVEIKGCHLELRRSYQLVENCLYSSQYVTLSQKYLFLVQDNKIRYINVFSQQNLVKQIFNEMVEEENQLISVVGDDIPKVLYLSNINILCESFHILQTQYQGLLGQIQKLIIIQLYQLKRAKEEQYSSDYVVLFQQFKCQFPDHSFENFLVAMKLIFGKPFIIAENLVNYQQPQLLQLLDDVIQDNIDVLIYMQKQLKEFDKNGIIIKKLYEKIQQLNNFILTSESPQIAITSRNNTRNDQILRLIYIASRNLLQDIHNYYFYCLLGLYILQDYQLEDYLDYQQAYFLLLAACKLQQTKPIRNHLIQILSQYDLSQENTYSYSDINQGVNISIGCVLNYRSKEIIDVLVNSSAFHQNTYQIVKLYPLIDQKIKLELVITALVRQGEIFESQQELLLLITRYELQYGEEKTRQFMGPLIQKYCNQDLINAILTKYGKGDQLVISLLNHSLKFKSFNSLYKVLQQVDFKNDDKATIELLTPVFWNEQVLKGLSKIKLDYSLMTQIKRLLQLDLQQANLSSKEAVQERFILIKNQAQFLKSQGFPKQSAQLLMTFYEFLDLQEKQQYVLQYQIEVLDITLNTLHLLNNQDKYVLIFKDTSNIQFFKNIQKKKTNIFSKKDQKSNKKQIINYQQQLNETWNKINKQQNELMKPKNQENQIEIEDQIEIESNKNKLSLEQYIELEQANKLPDDFRFKHELYKSDKLKRASFLQKQLEYNRSKNHLDERSQEYINEVNKINRTQEDKQHQQKVQNYKVYQFQQMNDLLLIKQIQYFLSIKGFKYTDDYHVMALQLIEIVQHLENNYQVSSQEQLINSIMFYVPLMTFVSSYKINSYFTICLGICQTFKILEQLLNIVIDDNLTSVLARIIVRFLSQNQLDKLLVYYFSQNYTECAIQELVYLENYSVAEKLSLILLNKYTKAKLQGKSFTLKPETVEAITLIDASPQLSDALKLIHKFSQQKQERNEKFKQLQLAGISYEQYKYIKQKSNQNPQQIEELKQILLQKLAETKENQKQYEQDKNKKQQQAQGDLQNLELFFTNLNYKPQVRPKRKMRNYKEVYDNLAAQQQIQKKQDAPSQDSYSFNEQQQFKLTAKKQYKQQQDQMICDQQLNQGDYFQSQQNLIISPKYTNALSKKGQQNPLKVGLKSDMIIEEDSQQEIQPKFTIKVSDASKLNIAIEDPYNLGPFVNRDLLFKKSKGQQDSKKKADRQEQSQISIISEVKEISDFQKIPYDKLNVELEIREKDNEIYYQDRKRKKRQIDVMEQFRMDQEEQELYNKYFQPQQQAQPEKRLLLQDAFQQSQNLIGQQSIMQQSLISFQQLNQSAPAQQNIQGAPQNAIFSQGNQLNFQPAFNTNTNEQQNQILLFPQLNQSNKEPYDQQNPQQDNILLRENFVISTESQILQPPQQVDQQQNSSFQQADQSMLFSNNDSRVQQSSQKPQSQQLFLQRMRKERKNVPLVYEKQEEQK